MTAGCPPAMGHRTGSPQEGADRKVNGKSRIRHSATSTFGVVGWKEQPEEFWLSKDPRGSFLKAITPVLVDVTRVLTDLCRK